MDNKLIYKQMNLVMKDVGSIGKTQTNTQQGFKFRGIDNFVNALYPALTKHGVFMTPECISYAQELKEVVRSSGKAGLDKHVSLLVKYHFYAEDGSSVTVGPIPAEGLDSGDKATNKALSAALKYALIQTFSIPTEDMVDGDSDSPTIGQAAVGKPVTSYAKPALAPTTTTTAAAAPTATVAEVTASKPKTTFRQATKAAPVAANGSSTDEGWL